MLWVTDVRRFAVDLPPNKRSFKVEQECILYIPLKNPDFESENRDFRRNEIILTTNIELSQLELARNGKITCTRLSKDL